MQVTISCKWSTNIRGVTIKRRNKTALSLLSTHVHQKKKKKLLFNILFLYWSVFSPHTLGKEKRRHTHQNFLLMIFSVKLIKDKIIFVFSQSFSFLSVSFLISRWEFPVVCVSQVVCPQMTTHTHTKMTQTKCSPKWRLSPFWKRVEENV